MCSIWICVLSSDPFLFRWSQEYLYFILSWPNRKYDKSLSMVRPWNNIMFSTFYYVLLPKIWSTRSHKPDQHLTFSSVSYTNGNNHGTTLTPYWNTLSFNLDCSFLLIFCWRKLDLCYNVRHHVVVYFNAWTPTNCKKCSSLIVVQ